MTIPRAEHPQPQMMREHWINLNGIWQFEIDKSMSGEQRGYAGKESLSDTIRIPSCPESHLSGL